MMASLECKERAEGPSAPPSLLLESLAHWVETQPTKKVVTWVDEGGRETACFTYEQLDQETRSLASYLSASGVVKPNDPVLLVYPPSLDFLVAFLACLRIGAIAVPVYPPEAGKAQKDLSMFVAVRSSCGATVALSTTRYCQAKQLDDLRSYFSLTQSRLGLGKNGAAPTWPDIEWLATDTPQARGHKAQDQAPTAPAQPNDIAFLQYTSGSTSEPKGVMISHANLAANLSAIIASLKAGRDTVVASWLPQYHDMGLIGAYLGAIYCGGSGYYMSPLTFIRRPSLWVEAMSRYQATHIQAPSFAYGLSARKFRSAQHPFHGKEEPNAGKEALLDLSSVRHMINGAEPVDVRGMHDFYKTFGKFGLRSGVIYPTYGLAENTVFVTSNGRRTLNVDRTVLETDGRAVDCVSGGVTIVGCGDVAESARLGIEVKIVDPDTHEQRPDGTVGEIWVRGLSRAAGYFGREEQSVQTFGARLKGQLKEGDKELPTYQHKGRTHVSPWGFLRTGDQGVILHNELFITGRLKDLIIVRGRNVYPHDLERCVEHTLANEVRGGCTAAFATMQSQGHDTTEGETLAFAVEVRDEGLSPSCAEALGLSIRRVLAQTHNAHLSTLYLLRPRTIPKTTSGKIARAWVRKAAEAGTLDTILTWHAPPDYEETISNNEGLESVVEGQSREERHGNEAARTGDKDVDSMGLEEIVEKLQAEVARITKEDASSILVDAPLAALGLDSLQGMQLHSLLEERFAVAVPEFVMFDKDTTLTVLGKVVKLHGLLPTPTTLVDLGRLANLELKAEEARAKAKASKGSRGGRKTTTADLLPLCTTRSSLLTGRFPPHHLRSSAESANDTATRLALWRLRLLSLTPTSPLVFAFFAFLAAVCTLATSSSLHMVVAVLACLLSVRLLQGPFAPGSSGLSQQQISLMWRLFSFKVTYEGEVLPAERPVLMVLVNIDPHPIPTAQMLLSLAFPVVFGRQLTLLLDEQPSAFSGPFVYQVLKVLGARPVSDLTAVVAEKKCALISRGMLSSLDDARPLSNVSIVPAVVLATPSTLDKRTPVTVILGSPIILSDGVNKAFTSIERAVMDAAGRLFDKHKEAWGLHDDASLSQ